MREWLANNRPVLIRIIIATILWAIIIFCFFTSIRTTNLTNNAIANIRERTITPKMVTQERLLVETAENFVYEWSTFDTADQEDYKKRLKRYLGNININPPSGIQRCNYASATSIEKSEENKELYRVSLTTNISRVVTSFDNIYNISPERIVSKKDVEGQTELKYWQNYQSDLEITCIINNDNEIEIIGTPVLKSISTTKGRMPDTIIGTKEAPEDFKIFASQVLDMYFAGENMGNFVSSDYDIKPIGGYIVESAKVTAFSKEKDTAKAVVKVSLSAEGIKNLEQVIILEAIKNDKWLLTRLGGF